MLYAKEPKKEQPQQPTETSQSPLTMKVLTNGGMWLMWYCAYSTG